MEPAIIASKKRRHSPTENGAESSRTPPPPSHLPGGDQHDEIPGLGHFDHFQVCLQGKAWVSEPPGSPPITPLASCRPGIFESFCEFIFEGSAAEPLAADLSGSARPADEITGADPVADFCKGSTKHLEHFLTADSRRTRAKAEAGPVLQEEACVPAEANLGLPAMESL